MFKNNSLFHPGLPFLFVLPRLRDITSVDSVPSIKGQEVVFIYLLVSSSLLEVLLVFFFYMYTGYSPKPKEEPIHLF